MPTIPMPRQPDVISAPYSGAAPADQSARYRGQAALGEGIANVGTVMERFALQSAKIKNEADVVNAQLVRDKAHADIQNELQNEPDYNKWEEIQQRHVKEATAAALKGANGQGVSEVVRRQIEQDNAAFTQKVGLTVRNQAQRQQNTENDQVMAEGQRQAEQAGNREQAHTLLDMRAELGTISQADRQVESAKVDQRVDVNLFNKDLAADPVATLKNLDDQTPGGAYRFYKNVSEDQRMSMRREAETAHSKLRAETIQDLQDRIELQGQYVDDTELQAHVKAGRLTAHEAKNIMSVQTRLGVDPNAEVQYELQLRNAMNYDPFADKTGKERAKILGDMAGLPREWRINVSRVLQERAKPTPISTRTEYVHREIDRLRTDGRLGREGDAQTAMDVIGLHEQVNRYAEDHPTASPTDITGFMFGLVKDRVARTAPLLNALSGRKAP